MVTTQNGSKQHDIHPGGAKRLSALVDDYVLTMQHALRQDLRSQLISRAKDEAGVLPEFSPAEMFDYLVDTDDEFFNWCFPFCAIVLKKDNLGYLHSRIISDFRKTLDDPSRILSDLRKSLDDSGNGVDKVVTKTEK